MTANNSCICGKMKDGRAKTCWTCHKEKRKIKAISLGPYRKRKEVLVHRNSISKAWNKRNINSVLCTHAKRRAKQLKLPFDLTKEDIFVPLFCPVLSIKLNINNTRLKDDSPTVDRIKPKLGYVKGNIAVISFRANRIKNDASASELQAAADWLKRYE